MDTVSVYSFGSFAWLSAQAVPLIVWPTFISTLLSVDAPNRYQNQYGHPSSVEQYFARSLGLSQLAIGLLLVVLSGALPLASMTDSPADTVSPYADAVVLVSMLYHASSTFYSYARWNGSGQMAYLLGCLGSSAFAAFGLGTLLFAGDKGRLSKRTGADKRTSGWPFKNSEADRKRPKHL
ncbi:hypothetical protein B0T26DRAFT_688270 [Lasiosphaeria miniovina]|uniref:Uncharacterized protein n=1 Tax=Lasiosphaeria miniovina TaxID=1954250 RepID=A0AA40BHP5_9PEZI|nr:uncharacterized protein B0T26DRAFT_688270 [Lasiosphaeria miniovina]KAK0734380.1 hypothetical protein B0T26DRAFT_688270 [Lasiosphaeria miniovina]